MDFKIGDYVIGKQYPDNVPARIVDVKPDWDCITIIFVNKGFLKKVTIQSHRVKKYEKRT